MTEMSIGVYEIIYTNIDAYDDYEFKFVANGIFDNSWSGIPNSENTVYWGNDNITFTVEKDNSTVRIVLNLAKFDYIKETGATLRYPQQKITTRKQRQE